ncbi:MAG: hypothetical protein QOH60_2544 [Mycobacterium sp.]|jgi:hypothetical protein|nr:hypothetical protein [Mycobacterium sp.]
MYEGQLIRSALSVPADRFRAHEQRSAWASIPGNKFREVARTTQNPTTKLLADGLTVLTEALRELDAKLEKVEQQVRS